MLLSKRCFLAIVVLASASIPYIHEAPKSFADTEKTKMEAEQCFANPSRACLFDEAISTAERTPLQGYTLYEISKRIAKTGDAKHAQDLLLKALKLVMKGYTEGQPITFQWIVDTIVSVGDSQLAKANLAEALILANSIDEVFARVAAVMAVAKAQARNGDINQALATANGVHATLAFPEKPPQWLYPWWDEYPIPKNEIQAFYDGLIEIDDNQLLIEIATTLANTGREEDAIATAEKIGNPDTRKKAYQNIAMAHARAGNVEKALEIAKKLDKEEISISGRVWTLTDVAESLVKAGELEQASVVLDVALGLAANIRSFEQFPVGQRLAIMLVRVGRLQDALAIVETMKRAASRAEAFRSAADVLAEMGRPKQAQELLGRAIALARKIKGGYRSSVLREIADTLTRTGNTEHAVSVLEEALAAAEEAKVVDVHFKPEVAYKEIAVGHVKAGNIDRAWTLVEKIKSPDIREFAYSGIATAHAEAGNVEEALATANKINSPNRLAETFAEIAATLPE